MKMLSSIEKRFHFDTHSDGAEFTLPESLAQVLGGSLQMQSIKLNRFRCLRRVSFDYMSNSPNRSHQSRGDPE